MPRAAADQLNRECLCVTLHQNALQNEIGDADFFATLTQSHPHLFSHAMLEHPVLVNRPIVCTPKGVRLCRLSETVPDLLDRLPLAPLFKEDGQLLIDAEDKRVA